MFYHRNPTASPAKHVIYLLAATILGLILSFILHALIEMFLLQTLEKQGAPVIWYGGCALPPVIRYGLWIVGGAGGFLTGRYWWRKIYIEKVWCQKNKLTISEN